MNKTVIGISGKKRHGKDTCANVITGCLSGQIIEVKYFAGNLKRSMAVALGLEEDYFFADESKDELFQISAGLKVSGRLLLQMYGTDAIRKGLHEDFWVYALLNEIGRSKADVILIPDVRFPNEFKAIKDIGGYVIRVERNGLNDDDSHPSETALDNCKEFDARIDNSFGYMDQKFIIQIQSFLRLINKL